jgi:hypothetical protein
MNGMVFKLFICRKKGEPMIEQKKVEAIRDMGLEGDRYCYGEGSFNKGHLGKRQVTLINKIFFNGTGFDYDDSRRNIVTDGVELMWLIDKEFEIGGATMRGVKYCDPCERPTILSGTQRSFKEMFFDRGGLIAEVIKGGWIRQGDLVIPPPKGY